ncbi:hypothetical protein CupriaWKF_27960 [Cupriavidus sp. WKF15]|uniref:hypothetical protein n=1 Tax=Cupriavidus sp. WKF15 TaxID=3032282 RepID=UPI0023E2599F|nr:hypothetical protein [Cupriavidus sp. WKF15]WER48609.1 hypothetical protein CupriaWKF_27960 [Cupriavidus sp. WKF15]
MGRETSSQVIQNGGGDFNQSSKGKHHVEDASANGPANRHCVLPAHRAGRLRETWPLSDRDGARILAQEDRVWVVDTESGRVSLCFEAAARIRCLPQSGPPGQPGK